MNERESAPAGLGPIPTLPVFFKLKGRMVVVAGGSQPAVWKAELLASTGAEVTVFDPAPCPEMITLKARLGDALGVVARTWTLKDLAGAALAIGALEGPDAALFRDAAHSSGVPVNIIDVPELCDFQFGTLVARSPLLIAISTDGAAPVFGQALRARIEALLPANVSAWARAAKEWRPDLQSRALSFAARRRFWEVFADKALAGTGLTPTDQDRNACLTAALGQHATLTGTLDLVGLGPGDSDLITLRAVRALQNAEVIVHAPDLSPALTALGRREAKTTIEDRSDATTAQMIADLVADGRYVVWAARGDPSTCACWSGRRAALTIDPRHVVTGLPCQQCARIQTLRSDRHQ